MKRKRMIAIVPVVALLLMGFTCSHATKNLATASDAIAHALANAQTAAKQAAAQGVISQADEANFETYLVKVSEAGLVLNQGIRANESASTLSAKVNSFLDAFNQLQMQGLAGIKDDKTKLALSTIITGAESSVAIIAATVGTGGK